MKYNAYISGRSYQGEDYPRLDSIKFALSHKYYEHNTITVIEKVKPQKRKWLHIQPQATVGYDVVNKQWGGVVGIGLGIDIGF